MTRSKLTLYNTLFILLILFTSPFLAYGQRLTVFYFGSSNCGYCNEPNFIQSIKYLRSNWDVKHKNITAKFIMVCMDRNIAKGIKFIKKYGDYWDEISIGSFYENELALANLNKTSLPGVPHLLIYREIFKDAGYGTKLIADKKLIKNIEGAKEIIKWVNSGMKLK